MSKIKANRYENTATTDGGIDIDTSGSVGIGTASPVLSIGSVSGKVLHVAGAGTTGARFQNTSGTSIEFFAGSDAIINTGTSTNMAFKINDTERLRIDSSGRVGIGTSPGRTLDVSGSIRSGGSTNPYLALNDNTTEAYFEIASSVTRISSGTSQPLAFRIGSTEAARLDTSGRLLVGTTTEGNGAADDLTLATTGNTGITIRSGASSQGAIYFSDGTSGTAEYDGFITYQQGSTPTTDYMSFGTDANERMRIDSSGKLLLGTSSSIETHGYTQSSRASGNNTTLAETGSLANNEVVRFLAKCSSPSRTLQVSVAKHSGITNPVAYLELNQEDGNQSFFWFDNSGIARTSITFTHTGTTSGTVIGTQTSDERLKNVGANVAYGLAEVKQLQPKQYALKTEPDTNKLGFIAQEVESIIPEVVFNTNEPLPNHEEGDRTKLGMEYVQLIPVLVNAIKELSAEVDTLKTKVAALEV